MTTSDVYRYDRFDPAFDNLGDYRGSRVGDAFPAVYPVDHRRSIAVTGRLRRPNPRAADRVINPRAFSTSLD